MTPQQIADRIANKVSPALVAAFEAQRESIVAASGNILVRSTSGLWFPLVVREIPSLSRVGLDTVAVELSNLKGSDILAFLEFHAAMVKARG